MSKQRWKGSMKVFRNHIDPEVEEQLKWIKIGKSYTSEQPQSLQYYQRLWDCSIGNKSVQFKARLPAQCYPECGFLWYTEWQRVRKIENNVRRSLKLIKCLNPNRDGNMKKRTELTQLIEDIHKEYQSLYALYDNLRGEVRKKVHGTDEDSSSNSSSGSESYFSPEELNGKNDESNSEHKKETESSNQKPETPDSEDALLKDKLTSTSVVKAPINLDLMSSSDEVPEYGEITKNLEFGAKRSQSRRQKLLDECAQLKEKLAEREEEILYVTKKHKAFGEQKLAEIQELGARLTSLKIELETISIDKNALEEQVECKSNEAKQLKEENSGLQAKIRELEASKVEQDQFSSLLKKFEQDDQQSLSKFEGLVAQVKDLQLQVDSLRSQKHELEECLTQGTEEISAQINGLMDRIDFLQHELEKASSYRYELELQLRHKSEEASQYLGQVGKLNDKLTNKPLHEQGTIEDLKVKVKDLQTEVNSLSSQKIELEDQVISSNGEADILRVENEELRRKILDLETTMKEKENALSILQDKFKASEDEMSTQIMSLTAQINNFQQELKMSQTEKSGPPSQIELEKQLCSEIPKLMERNNIELENVIADQQKTIKGLEDVIAKLNQELKQVRSQFADSKSNYHIAERRVEEMAEEFCKKLEDKTRILSRRIRVAEQMHLENKEWYQKTRNMYEHETKTLKEQAEQNEIELQNIQDMTLTANDTLLALDSVALKFEECTANFLNRISKVSCELKFAKDWAMRKNKAIVHVKDDLDCILAQLDDKEGEILIYREKVWKSDNKVRELEKMIKEREDGMLALKEEKREAIRQLCVWIDYHRSRSDYYKKMLSDITAAYRRTS